MRRIVLLSALALGLLTGSYTYAQEKPTVVETPTVFVFGQKDCDACRREVKYLFDEGITYQYLDVSNQETSALYTAIREKHDIGEVLPLAIVGESVIVGYDNPQTANRLIQTAVSKAKATDINSVEAHIARAPKQATPKITACTGLACDTSTAQVIYPVPFLGTVNLSTVSPLLLSLVLGFCVIGSEVGIGLLFILTGVLLFAGDKKQLRMFAGVFLLLEVLGVLYYFNGGFHTLHQFILLEAFAHVLTLNTHFILKELSILLYALTSFIDDALLLGVVTLILPHLETLEDKRPGTQLLLSLSAFFIGGVLVFHQLYFS